MHTSTVGQDEIVIERGRVEKNYWADLWRYRELFLILAWRDIAVRYKQTVIGVAWAVVRPFLTMIIFTVIFGRVAGLRSDGEAPYALMVFAATLPWSLFSTALGEASNSLIGNERLIKVTENASRKLNCRLPDQLCHPARIDGLLSVSSWLEHDRTACLHRLGCAGEFGTRPLDHSAEREISRFPLRNSLCRPVWHLYFANRLQQQRDPESVAPPLQPESADRRYRRIPLVHSRQS